MRNAVGAITLAVFISLSCWAIGASITGTNISAPVVPFTTDDQYPTHISKYGKGGPAFFNTTSERNQLSTQRREEGMFAYSKDTGKTYQLFGGVLNTNWKEFMASSTYQAGGWVRAVNNYLTAINPKGFTSPTYVAETGVVTIPVVVGNSNADDLYTWTATTSVEAQAVGWSFVLDPTNYQPRATCSPVTPCYMYGYFYNTATGTRVTGPLPNHAGFILTGPVVPDTDSTVGNIPSPPSTPWVDSQLFDNLSSAKQVATNNGKMLLVTAPGTVNNLTFGCPVSIINGGSITVNDGKVARYSEFNAGLDCYCLQGSGQHTFMFSKVLAVYPQWWGAKGDNSNDDTSAIQAAIDSIMSSGSTVSVVQLINGTYKISDTLRLLRYSSGNFSYATCKLLGDEFSSDGISTVTIAPTFADRPCILMQKTRGTVIRGIKFEGRNTLNLTLSQIINQAITSWAISGVRDNRYSPYTAICIDPYGSVPTSDDKYPGIPDYYSGGNNSGSSRVLIEKCYIRNFVVGVMITPNTSTQNAENITISDCWIDHAKSAIAVGQSQSRTVYVNRLTSWGCTRLIFDCCAYGRGNAPLPIITGCNIAGGTKYLLSHIASWGDGHVTGLYAEQLWSLGKSSASGLPVNFRDCYLHFIDPLATGVTSAPYEYDANSALFDSCYLGRYRSNAAHIQFSSVGKFQFINSSFDSFLFSYGGYTWGNNRFVNVIHRYQWPTTYVSYSNDRLVHASPLVLMDRQGFYDNNVIDVYNKKSPFYHYQYTTGNPEARVKLEHVDVTVSGNTATFTSGLAALLQVGDFLAIGYEGYASGLTYEDIDGSTQSWTAGVIGKISAIDGTTVSVRDIPQPLANGNFYLVLVYQRVWHIPTIGTTTAASNIITDVAEDSSISSTWHVGDRIQGVNLPDGSYITSIDASAKTITINNDAISSGVVDLYDLSYTTTGEQSTIPTGGIWPLNSRIVNLPALSGQPKAWVNTIAGAAYSATRNNNTAYGSGNWIKWTIGTTVWRCTTSGISDSTPPDITGKNLGDTVSDGTITWTLYSKTAANFISEGNL